MTRARRSRQAAPSRVLPPETPQSLVERPRLVEQLDVALARRVTTVVAGAGFGKSTLLAGWARTGDHAWYGVSERDSASELFAAGVFDALTLRVPGLAGEQVMALRATRGPDGSSDDERAVAAATIVCRALDDRLARELVLVLDDVHAVGESPEGRRFLETLCLQAPARLHLVLAGRAEPPVALDRLKRQGLVHELGGPELAFTPEETSALMSIAAPSVPGELAADVHHATGGWPVAVRLAVEALERATPPARVAVIEHLRRPGGPLFALLADEVFAREPPEVRRLVARVAPLERFTVSLCEALGETAAATILPSLARRGLFVDLYDDDGGWFSLGTPVREFALTSLALEPGELRGIRQQAARWLELAGQLEDAVRLRLELRDRRGTARLLRRHGSELLSAGAAAVIVEAAAELPPSLRDDAVDMLVGEALQAMGDWDGALQCFERVAAPDGTVDAEIAWRKGLIHHLRGDLDEALATYSAGIAAGGGDADVALAHAWRAAAYWLRGQETELRADADASFALATRAGDDQALAAAHTALALLAAFDGDRGGNDLHYLHALRYAEEAGDVLQVIRIRTNRGSRHLEEGSYTDAIVELEVALELADAAGFSSFRALALTNRGEALYRLGRLEEAVTDLEQARALYGRQGSRMEAYPLDKLGEVYAERGRNAQAAACYERAIDHAEAYSDLQGLVPALAGLARLRARESQPEAEAFAKRACEPAYGMAHARALVAAGWVALLGGDTEQARQWAEEAGAAAASRRDRAGLADALELDALATPDRAGAEELLAEATSLWQELGVPVGVARVGLMLALLQHDEQGATAAEHALGALGARGQRRQLDGVLRRVGGAALRIETLGRFRVIVAGEPLAPTAWQSRKARDLLKLLVARRARPVPREVLMDALWPGEAPRTVSPRLSVALSTVRSLLDPGRRHPTDQYVGGDKASLWLQRDRVEVDVETFLALSADALAAVRAREIDAVPALEAAEHAYAGDFLEEDLYEDWTVGLREEARVTYVDVSRALATTLAGRGETDTATRLYRRILERDAYDEPAHLGLVATLASAGRHGESRRCYRAYCARMSEIGVEAQALPGPPVAASSGL